MRLSAKVASLATLCVGVALLVAACGRGGETAEPVGKTDAAAPVAPGAPLKKTAERVTGDRPADCELVVQGRAYIDGECQFSPFGGDGSFQISGGDYFAYLNVTSRGVAEASWNADPASTHAQAPLGTVRRDGACWNGRGVRICVRDLSAADQRAAIAAQPDGLALWPEEASQACLGVQGRPEVGAAVTLRNCHVPADYIFKADASGALRGPGGLCLDLEAPGMGGAPTLILNTCPATGTGWTTRATATEAGPVRSADGQCLIIPSMSDPANPAFPYAVTAGPCAQAQRFIFGRG